MLRFFFSSTFLFPVTSGKRDPPEMCNATDQQRNTAARRGSMTNNTTEPSVATENQHKYIVMAESNSSQSSSSIKRPTGLDALAPSAQFAFLACGVFFFFGIHNILQEAMIKIPGFNYGVMLGYMEVVGT